MHIDQSIKFEEKKGEVELKYMEQRDKRDEQTNKNKKLNE